MAALKEREDAMSDPRRNEEGYLDLTAYHGTKNIIQEETRPSARTRT